MRPNCSTSSRSQSTGLQRQSSRELASQWFPALPGGTLSFAVAKAAHPMDRAEINFMREHQGNIDKLAEELQVSPIWHAANNDEARMVIAQDFLRDVSGGYGANLTFVRRLVAAAKRLLKERSKMIGG